MSKYSRLCRRATEETLLQLCFLGVQTTGDKLLDCYDHDVPTLNRLGLPVPRCVALLHICSNVLMTRAFSFTTTSGLITRKVRSDLLNIFLYLRNSVYRA
jgi:hypothetical protein